MTRPASEIYIMQPVSAPPDWEFAKVFIMSLALVIPPALTGLIAVAALRYGVGIEKSKHLNQELVKRRMKFYDDIAPHLNRLYCFYAAVGDWHGLNPAEIIKIKRCIDRDFHIYKYILSDDVFHSYQSFMKIYFFEFSKDGSPAKLRPDRKHIKKLMYEHYDERWDREFDCGCRCPSKKDHENAYIDLMTRLADNIRGTASGPIPPLPAAVTMQCSCSA